MSDPKKQPRNFLDGLGASDPLIQDSLRAIWARSQQKAAQQAEEAAAEQPPAEPADALAESTSEPASNPAETPTVAPESWLEGSSDEMATAPVPAATGDGISGLPDLLGVDPDDNPFQSLDQAAPVAPASRDAAASTRRSLIRRLYEADGGQGRDHVFRTTTRTAPSTIPASAVGKTQRAMILRQGPQGVEGLAELNAALLEGWHVVHTTGLPLTVTGDVPDGVQFAALVVLEQTGGRAQEPTG